MVQDKFAWPLSFMVQDKFACPLSFTNDRAIEIEIFMHHYHLWCMANLSAQLSYMVQGKFASPLSFIKDRASENEICLHHYHFWCRTNGPASLTFLVQENLPAALSFMVQNKVSSTTIISCAGQICLPPKSFLNDRAFLIEIFLHHNHLLCRKNLPVPYHLWCRTNLSRPVSFMV